MIIHWVSLFAGLGMGLLPPLNLINCDCRYLTFEDLWEKLARRKSENERRRRWWKLPLVWIDPFRGYVAAMWVGGAFSASPDASGFMRLLPTIGAFGLIYLLVWAQTKGRGAARESLSPSAFLAGMIVQILPPVVSAAVLVMGVATAVALQSFTAGYVVGALTMVGVGFAFMGKSVALVLTAGAFFLPVFFSWFRGARLVMPVRC